MFYFFSTFSYAGASLWVVVPLVRGICPVISDGCHGRSLLRRIYVEPHTNPSTMFCVTRYAARVCLQELEFSNAVWVELRRGQKIWENNQSRCRRDIFVCVPLDAMGNDALAN